MTKSVAFAAIALSALAVSASALAQSPGAPYGASPYGAGAAGAPNPATGAHGAPNGGSTNSGGYAGPAAQPAPYANPPLAGAPSGGPPAYGDGGRGNGGDDGDYRGWHTDGDDRGAPFPGGQPQFRGDGGRPDGIGRTAAFFAHPRLMGRPVGVDYSRWDRRRAEEAAADMFCRRNGFRDGAYYAIDRGRRGAVLEDVLPAVTGR